MKILIVAPHPDDDALGCAGTARLHVLAGDEVRLLYMTSGELGIPGMAPEAVGPMREAEARECNNALEAKGCAFWREPDGKLEDSERTRDLFKSIFSIYNADIIYAPHAGEAHPDHKACSEIVKASSKGKECRFYEVWTPLSHWDLVVDITSTITIKRAAIRCFASQVIRNPFAEGILGLNHYRGLFHAPNVMYAEAFEVVK